MTNGSLILLICVSIAFFAAIVAVIYNRRQVKQLRAMQQLEPIMGNSCINRAENSWDEDEDDGFEVSEVRVRTDESYVTATNQNKLAQATAETQARAESMQASDVIVLNIMAGADRPYMGYELLQSLLSVGLRYGKMKIFHRHEQINGQGQILFSLASATKPGIFELDKMSTVLCKGLTLFMQISQSQNVASTFELMLETARQLVEDLGGALYDEHHQPLAEEKVEELRAILSTLEHA